MLRARIIPSLLLQGGRLVKTVNFATPKYVGDSLNAVRIFNEKEVDELAVFDIDATRLARPPDLALIRKLASECRMPLCYGGGVNEVDQVETIVGLGVEKVALGASAIERPDLITASVERVGSQSVVAVLDIRASGRQSAHEVWTHNGTQATGLDAVSAARRMQALGVGEIIINSIDRDGTMKGYDLNLARAVRAATTVPLTMLGGAGSLADIERLVREFGVIGAAAGSLFVFKGRYRAVLINYPDSRERDRIATPELAAEAAATSPAAGGRTP